MGADAADVFVHDLFKTLKAMNRQEIARRKGPGDDFVAADFVISQWLVNDLLEFCVLRLTELRLFRAQVLHVLNCRLAGDPAFREGSRRELVRGAADGIAGAEEALDGHHPIVAPLIFRWCAILRTAGPGA